MAYFNSTFKNEWVDVLRWQNGSLNSRAAVHEYASDTVMDENALKST